MHEGRCDVSERVGAHRSPEAETSEAHTTAAAAAHAVAVVLAVVERDGRPLKRAAAFIRDGDVADPRFRADHEIGEARVRRWFATFDFDVRNRRDVLAVVGEDDVVVAGLQFAQREGAVLRRACAGSARRDEAHPRRTVGLRHEIRRSRRHGDRALHRRDRHAHFAHERSRRGHGDLDVGRTRLERHGFRTRALRLGRHFERKLLDVVTRDRAQFESAFFVGTVRQVEQSERASIRTATAASTALVVRVVLVLAKGDGRFGKIDGDAGVRNGNSTRVDDDSRHEDRGTINANVGKRLNLSGGRPREGMRREDGVVAATRSESAVALAEFHRAGSIDIDRNTYESGFVGLDVDGTIPAAASTAGVRRAASNFDGRRRRRRCGGCGCRRGFTDVREFRREVSRGDRSADVVDQSCREVGLRLAQFDLEVGGFRFRRKRQRGPCRHAVVRAETEPDDGSGFESGDRRLRPAEITAAEGVVHHAHHAASPASLAPVGILDLPCQIQTFGKRISEGGFDDDVDGDDVRYANDRAARRAKARLFGDGFRAEKLGGQSDFLGVVQLRIESGHLKACDAVGIRGPLTGHAGAIERIIEIRLNADSGYRGAVRIDDLHVDVLDRANHDALLSAEILRVVRVEGRHADRILVLGDDVDRARDGFVDGHASFGVGGHRAHRLRSVVGGEHSAAASATTEAAASTLELDGRAFDRGVRFVDDDDGQRAGRVGVDRVRLVERRRPQRADGVGRAESLGSVRGGCGPFARHRRDGGTVIQQKEDPEADEEHGGEGEHHGLRHDHSDGMRTPGSVGS